MIPLLRLWILGLSLALLAGCSALGGLFERTEDTAVPPTPLQPLATGYRVRVRWSRDVGAGAEARYLRLVPAVDGGRVFAADRKGRVRAYAAADGKPVWAVDLHRPVTGAVGVGEGLVLVGTAEGAVIALDWRDGKVVWQARTTGEVLAPPQAAGGLVVVQSADGNLVGFDAATGERKWIFDRSVPPLSLRGTSVPLLLQDAVFTGLANGKVVALEAARGFPVWTAILATPRGRTELARMVDVDAPVRFAGGLLYAVAYHGRLAALEPATGQVRWERPLSSWAGLDVDAERVYVTDEDSAVWAFDRTNGASRWRQAALLHRRLTAPVVVDDYLLVGDFEGYVHVLSRRDGRLLARLRLDDQGILAPPVAVEDQAIVYGRGGRLARIEILAP
ncbi:MAG: outer membrane protein assembly factor BamB [Gammaproteobacteria bacterium]|nr:MAG: outer membrane protein assembly factor BamB [Gammaproteobacteria bacterium]